MKRFRNRTRLKAHYTGQFVPGRLDLNRFPLAEDFELVLTAWGGRPGRRTFQPRFFSERHGVLADLSWWQFVENDVRCGLGHKMRVGTLGQPFWDADQGWHVIIFEAVEHVYVLEGGDEFAAGCHSWFRVRRDRYVGAWRSPRVLP